MAMDHGSSVKNDKQYSSKKGGKNSGKGKGGSKSQKRAADARGARSPLEVSLTPPGAARLPGTGPPESGCGSFDAEPRREQPE